MRIEWVLLAEGLTQDARGAWTAVGLNQNVFATDTFPAHTKRAVVTRLADLDEHQQLHFRYAVVAPSGRTLVAQESDLQLGDRRLPTLPASLDVPGEFVLSVTEYGEHRIECEVSNRGSNEIVLDYVSIYVVETKAFLTEPADRGPSA
ncbi:hypothetical protein GCM10009798_14160 [Nocardioides panacihumi]|uniref:Uncharacterized protein n=1 Tax=Nocardioides panacihumi TaxID=400774 RepID=A0ABN2QPC7_9ACTN